MPVVPDGSPLTADTIELGRWLFHDRALSADGTMSCATCHQAARAFTDGLPRSRGVDGVEHPLNTPGLANVVFQPRLNWANPELRELEQQIMGPLMGHGTPIRELGLDTEALRSDALATLQATPGYEALWRAAWDDQPWSWDLVVVSLASFVRSLVSDDAPWDRHQRGEPEALGDAARRGARLFFSHEGGIACHHCHGGFTFTSVARHADNPFDETAFFNIGLYDVDGDGAYPPGQQGLAAWTGEARHQGAFRTPTLRNLRWTGPYMHDGSIDTIREVLQHYQDGGRHVTDGPWAGDGRTNPNKDRAIGGMRLSDEQLDDLEAFLDALNDESFVDPARFGTPAGADPGRWGP